MLVQSRIVIDGTDITDLIAYSGVKWSRYDVDGPSTGRTIDGCMIRDRIATKIRLDITCRVMTNEEHSMLMQLLMPDFVQVSYEDPVYGLTTKTMYANNHHSTFYKEMSSGVEYWKDVSFPLVER